MDGYATGTNHGVFYNYDAHIPLLWYGNGIKKGQVNSVNYMTDIAPTILDRMRIAAPMEMEGKTLVALN